MNETSHPWLWHPLKQFGVTHEAAAINVSTIIDTWIALAVLLAVLLGARTVIRYHQAKVSASGASGPDLSGLAYTAYIIKTYIKSFVNLVEQTAGTFVYRYFAFIASLFTYILFCNWVALLPFVEEPTKDLNTTFALGIVTFFYIQKEKIRTHGFVNFLKEYFLPVEIFFPLNVIVGLAMFPLIALDEIATVVSLSFRLFGNIFGGAVIMEIVSGLLANSLLRNLFATASGMNLILVIFFVLFEGGLQAFVFAILALTNITMAVAVEGELT